MTDPRDQIVDLLCEAEGLPHGPAKVALLEEAVQLADSLNDLDLGFEARNGLMEAANFSGRPDIILVAFTWCLAQYDRDRERFDSYDILWKYKWVITIAYQFPEISRPRLEQLLDDIDRRYREAGSTNYGVSLVRRKLMVHFGEWQKARAAHSQFRKCRRDFLSDCPACVAASNCYYFASQRHWGRAVQAAQPVLQNRLTCTEEPHRTLANVLRPLFHLGRLEEARVYQRRGYRLVGQANHFVEQHAEHLQFAVLLGDMAQAKRLLERHLSGALQIVTVDDRFQFLLAGRLWTDRLRSRGTRKLKVRLPKGLPSPDADGKSDVSALGAWFTAQSQEIAQRFDARNGTNAFQQQIDELPELLRLALD
ncbi:MAG: hypothetical protein HY040_18730 [Planctomycetes bacterium]|nr:hypothetical protein [Planctomycetota bacterium]